MDNAAKTDLIGMMSRVVSRQRLMNRLAFVLIAIGVFITAGCQRLDEGKPLKRFGTRPVKNTSLK